MNEEIQFPERHAIRDRAGELYDLLVDTNTNDWRFELQRDGVTVGSAKAVQAGGLVTLTDLRIHDRVVGRPIPQALWRLVGRKPKLVNFRRLGLGREMLRFIVKRARDFGADEIVVDLDDLEIENGFLASDFLVRQEFKIVPAAEGKVFGIARMILRSEITDESSTKRTRQPKRRQVDKINRVARRNTVVKAGASNGGNSKARRGERFTRETLARAFRPVSDLINGKQSDGDGLLDPAMRDRLRASNIFIPHGGDVRVLQYHIRDREQPTIFHRDHFKYEVQYDPFGTKAGTADTNFCVHFYMNKVRIYHEREEMLARVRRELSRLRLSGFKLKETERAFSFHSNFLATSHEQARAEAVKRLFPLLNRVHPMFYRIMDAYNIPLTKAQRRAVISGRKKLNFVDRTSPNYGKHAEFRREVPRHLRTAVFRRDKNVCQHCERKHPVSLLHADHVLPIARGGLTTLANLQALCGPCNLRKGKRLESELWGE